MGGLTEAHELAFAVAKAAIVEGQGDVALGRELLRISIRPGHRNLPDAHILPESAESVEE